MEILSIKKSARTSVSTEIVFINVPKATADADIRSAAYVAAHEDPESCFGENVNRYDDGMVIVRIHRD